MKRRHLLCGLGVAAAVMQMPTLARAQSRYPSQPIKLVVPFAPGGGGDVLGRLIGAKLSDSMRQPVIVDNRPGASTVIATEYVARATPDGHTILLNVPLIVQTATLMSKLPYDPIKDLTPVAEVVNSSLWMAVNPQKVDARNLKEFVAQVKAQPGSHSYGSIGMGSTTHLFGHALNEEAHLDMVHVPFKGSSVALNALLAGEVSTVILDYVTLKPQVSAGKARLIAVTGSQRSSWTPEVATFAEQGYKGLELMTWAGLFVPSKTSPDIVRRLHDEVMKVVREPDVAAKLADLGYVPGNRSQAAFAQQVSDEKQRWAVLIKQAGVRLE
ncbi:tripartite tricarboxylate transporter substrate binding protein [Variovorax sp. YR216]|uniref:Bug family tripartite tricarboxylate transporter substrate binding protein n=1 Tax=Variovorax sp. YR216 TaxID=1882828 RepID=UPI0008996743|nr:tripartite tricarboxylate transporter substrate binding protein [Variovorax sp. YR216]SEB20041.1 Tripartite-type tricarboxylate transporter, receptor component TctC [Variovorax sp. YR216]